MTQIDLEALRVEFSERSRPIVFWTGAGVSAPSIPSWTGLRDYLLEFMKDRAKSLNPVDQRAQLSEHAQIKATSDLWLGFERLEKAIGREAYVQRIKERLALSEKGPLPQAHTRLWELAPTGIVTLNLDLFTQRGAGSHPAHAIPIPILPGKFTEYLNVFRERRPFIAYPHGHLDNPNFWTFTKSELEKRLADSRYIEWLNLLFRASTVVFVGVTADDVAIGSPIERIAANRIPLSGHFWLTARDDIAADQWAGQHGVRVVRYDNKAGDHSELLHLLHGLRAPVRQEDPEKERPVFPRSTLPDASDLPEPDVLANEPDERKRQLLNSRAKQILQNPDESLRDREYSEFLQRYGRSVYGAWYASTMPGENEFLGYNLMSEIDGGAFGTVFKGTDKEGNTVAIKLLKSENFRKPGFHRSFRRGANSLRIITDRGIEGVVKYIDAAEIPPSIVMSWSDGQSLIQLVESGQLADWEERIEVALQLASILRSCHGLPERVLHRDLRPANVMVENCYDSLNEWKVVVLDFDLSWHKGAEDHSIMHSPAFGYLAPEQRQKGKYTTRSALVDSYGFGMSVYFICTGKNPFPDQHLHVNWSKDLFRLFESKRCSGWLSLPRRLARLVQNITQDEQSARATMSQIEGELESLKAALSTSARVPIVDVVTEELAARTEHFHGYSWSDSESRASLNSANGLNLSLQTVTGKRIIQFTASWSNSGAQDWNHIDRMLSQALPKLTDSLKKVCESVEVSKARHAFSVTAQIDADQVRADPSSIAKELDRAVEHAAAIANF
jgi:eukaryotic-like serine/threonine-protein kinase